MTGGDVCRQLHHVAEAGREGGRIGSARVLSQKLGEGLRCPFRVVGVEGRADSQGQLVAGADLSLRLVQHPAGAFGLWIVLENRAGRGGRRPEVLLGEPMLRIDEAGGCRCRYGGRVSRRLGERGTRGRWSSGGRGHGRRRRGSGSGGGCGGLLRSGGLGSTDGSGLGVGKAEGPGRARIM